MTALRPAQSLSIRVGRYFSYHGTIIARVRGDHAKTKDLGGSTIQTGAKGVRASLERASRSQNENPQADVGASGVRAPGNSGLFLMRSLKFAALGVSHAGNRLLHLAIVSDRFLSIPSRLRWSVSPGFPYHHPYGTDHSGSQKMRAIGLHPLSSPQRF